MPVGPPRTCGTGNSGAVCLIAANNQKSRSPLVLGSKLLLSITAASQPLTNWGTGTRTPNTGVKNQSDTISLYPINYLIIPQPLLIYTLPSTRLKALLLVKLWHNFFHPTSHFLGRDFNENSSFANPAELPEVNAGC